MFKVPDAAAPATVNREFTGTSRTNGAVALIVALALLSRRHSISTLGANKIMRGQLGSTLIVTKSAAVVKAKAVVAFWNAGGTVVLRLRVAGI